MVYQQGANFGLEELQCRRVRFGRGGGAVHRGCEQTGKHRGTALCHGQEIGGAEPGCHELRLECRKTYELDTKIILSEIRGEAPLGRNLACLPMPETDRTTEFLTLLTQHDRALGGYVGALVHSS